jgi:radical SAM superfamily enzyme YgiQ (UPF0313 family)
MRILLIEPAKSSVSMAGEDVFLFEPLALEYLAAGVNSDHDVRILDQRIDDTVEKTLEEYRPDIVGITGYTVHANQVKRLAELAKAWNPEVLTVVGGHHATVAPRDFDTPDIDLVVVGEGVASFRKIVHRFDACESFAGIPGVWANTHRGLEEGVANPARDLDDLPFPDRSLTASYRHAYYSEYMQPLASVRTSKGCPFRCNFCALWKITGGRYLRREPAKIVEELAQIDEEFVFFADDESLVDAERMKRLAELIRESGIRKRYFLYGRSDTIAKHPGLLALWRDIGLERVFVGLEFFRDSDLEFINKGSTTNNNRQAVRVLQDLGIDIYASFIVRPEFTTEDFAELRRYCRSIDLKFASFAVLTPLPGTDLYDEVEERLLTREPEFYDFIHTVLPTTLPLEEFYEQYYRLYTTTIPLRRVLAFMLKFRLKEVPASLAKFRRWSKRLRTLHEDYNRPFSSPDLGVHR